MMFPDLDYKSLGIISITLTWIGLLYTVIKWRGNKSMSFSLHAAQTKSGQIYYFLLFALTLPLFLIFILKWYVPALNLPNAFVYLAIIGIIGQLIAVIVPAVGGNKEKIHNTGAYLMALTLIPLSIIIAAANLSLLVNIIALTGVLYMISATIFFLTVKKSHAYYLYFQATYIALFHFIIILSTYSM